MPYWDVVLRSFRIPWRHKYLWLLAFFAGEGGGGASASFNASIPSNGGGTSGRAPDIGAIPQQAATWLADHAALVALLVALAVLIAIALFALAAVCEGAVVRASAEHDADRSFGLGSAWRCGVATMGTMIRFRLLLIALYLPVLIVLLALGVGFVLAIVGRSVGAAVALGLVGLLVFLVAFLYAIYLSFLDRLGTRAAILDQLGATAALVRAHRLLRKRVGRVLLVWLLSIAVGIAVGTCLLVAVGILAVPVVFLGIAAFATGSPVFWVLVAITLVTLFPILFVIQGFVSAQGSTYWTLAFRRLEIDQLPAYGYQHPVPAPPPAPA